MSLVLTDAYLLDLVRRQDATRQFSFLRIQLPRSGCRCAKKPKAQQDTAQKLLQIRQAILAQTPADRYKFKKFLRNDDVVLYVMENGAPKKHSI